MKKIVAAATVLLLAGCSTIPVKQGNPVSIKKAVKKEQAVDATPNQAVKKRWFPKFKINWLHK